VCVSSECVGDRPEKNLYYRISAVVAVTINCLLVDTLCDVVG
jgi:hypothetical protein